MTNDKQRVDFPVGENVREDKRGTPRGRLVELLMSKSCFDNECPDVPCDRCKYIGIVEEDAELIADYLLADGWMRPTVEIKSDNIINGANLGLYLEDLFLTKEEAEKALNNVQNGNSCEGGASDAD